MIDYYSSKRAILATMELKLIAIKRFISCFRLTWNRIFWIWSGLDCNNISCFFIDFIEFVHSVRYLYVYIVFLYIVFFLFIIFTFKCTCISFIYIVILILFNFIFKNIFHLKVPFGFLKSSLFLYFQSLLHFLSVSRGLFHAHWLWSRIPWFTFLCYRLRDFDSQYYTKSFCSSTSSNFINSKKFQLLINSDISVYT